MSSTPVRPVAPLDELVDHCLRARELTNQLNAKQARELIDMLLFEVGKLIASDLARRTLSDDGNL